MKSLRLLSTVLALTLCQTNGQLASGYEEKSQGKHQPSASGGVAKLALSSSALKDNQTVPKDYTIEGRDISPPLLWSAPPAKAQSLAIVVDDPDAPGAVWYHWILFNLKPTTHGLGAAVPKVPTLSDGALQGTNDFGKVGYNGPAPPRGALHRYRFKLLALDKKLSLPAGVKKDEFLRAINGHIVDQAQLTGTFRH